MRLRNVPGSREAIAESNLAINEPQVLKGKWNEEFGNNNPIRIEIARQRYKIEAKNAELKQVYGYDKALSYGLDGMQMQGAMTIFAANIKRILKLS